MNEAPLFSICVITRNESQTLPRLLESLKEFKERGGEVVVVDTGSKDNTTQIAKDAGCVVEEVWERFKKGITRREAISINNKFIVPPEQPVVGDLDKFFDFSAARNYCASLAKNDVICWADADEIFTSLNIDALNEYIRSGFQQFEYNFVYAHDEYGNEAIKFIQSKMYDRRICKWVNMVHEVLSGNAKIVRLDESVFKLEHFQIPAEHRGNYLKGLALDCWLHPKNDRNAHYFAREMMYCGRYKSAIKLFDAHIGMNAWPAEKAQSWIFKGDCYAHLNDPQAQVNCYNQAIYIDGSRREPFIKLARFYKHNNKPRLTIAYTKAAMELPWVDFYANDKGMYEHEPHELLYWAYGFVGDIESAKHHFTEAYKNRPNHPNYARDKKYYFGEQ